MPAVSAANCMAANVWAMTQPLLELTLVRPWHWGIAIVGDPTALVPDIEPGKPVTVGGDTLVLLVRHAQDVDVEVLSDETDWSTVTIHLRSLVAPDPTDRVIVGEMVIDKANERISVGDADGEIAVPTPAPRTQVVVSAATAAAPMDEVWIDLWPAAD